MSTSSFLRLVAIAFLLFGGYTVFAQSTLDAIEYPVAELGNCENKEACHDYCDEPDRIRECVSFAERHGLMSAQEVEKARRFADAGAVGPGGCRGHNECEIYCEDVANIQECLAFAEEHGFLEGEELDEVRRVAAALAAGAQLPGGCRSKAECEVYCENPSHIEACLDFAAAAGFIHPDELEDARRIAPFMARGEMPGQCRSREECERYCSQDANREECAVFFERAGLISGEEMEIFRKTGGRGPGGCQGKEECDAFCNDPANQQVCFSFAREHDLLSDEELGGIEEGVRRFQEGFSSAPPEVVQCLRDTVGTEVLDKVAAGTLLPTHDLGEKMRACFEQFGPKGPGGCATEEECQVYCSDPAHIEECGGAVNREELPPGFEESFEEEFRRQFEEQAHDQIPEEFRDQLPADFEARPFEFLEPPEGFDRIQEETRTQIEEQIRKQIEEETQKQIEEQIQIQTEEQLLETTPLEEHIGESAGTGSILNAVIRVLRHAFWLD